MRTTNSGLLAAVGGVAILMLSTLCRAESPTQAAVWKEHKYSFMAMSFTSTYSCDGLADKLKMLLLAAGARPDAKANPGACAMGFGRPDKLASADLTFHTLVPADSAVAGSDRVQATWKPVAIKIDPLKQLGRGDCELVERFATTVLPMFTTRNVINRTRCVPHQDSGSLIDLRFEALTAPKAAAKTENPG